MQQLVVAVLGSFVSVGIATKGVLMWRKASTIAGIATATATSKIGYAESGYREFVGKALRSNDLLKDPVTEKDCVWFRVKTEELDESTYRDSKGNQRIRRDWKEVDGAESSRPIVLDDGSAVCALDLHDADIRCRSPQVIRPGNGLFGRAMLRHTIWRILPGEQLYVLGSFTKGAGNRPGTMSGLDSSRPYVISSGSEKQFTNAEAWKSLLGILVVVLGVGVGLAVYFFLVV